MSNETNTLYETWHIQGYGYNSRKYTCTQFGEDKKEDKTVDSFKSIKIYFYEDATREGDT